MISIVSFSNVLQDFPSERDESFDVEVRNANSLFGK